MMGGLLVRMEHCDTRLQQETTQDGFIAWSLRAHGKSGAQFSNDDKRQPDLVGEFNNFDGRSIATAKIGVAVGIECDSHRSPPQVFINRVLRSQSPVELRILSPRPGDVGEIALL